MRLWLKLALGLAVRFLLVPTFACAQAAVIVNQPSSQPTESLPSPSPTASEQPLDRVNQIALFNDLVWHQLLEGNGVTLVGDFIAEPAANAVGYKGAGWVYAQELDFGAVFDLKKMDWSNDGTVRILFSDRVGNTIQKYTGAYIQNQSYWGQGQNIRLDEISYERSFLSDGLSVKAGFYSMGNEFGGLSYVCNFNNNGNCGHPLGLAYDANWIDSPTGNWGGRVKWTDPSGWYAQAGVYDVTPSRKDADEGFNLGFSHTTGVIAPVEIGYVHGSTPSDYPGTYKVGFYYDSSATSDLADPTEMVRGRKGGYVEVAQQIWKMRPGELEGISVFGVATYGDTQTGLFRTTYEAGGTWRGLISSRKDDYASLSWVQLNINSEVAKLEAFDGKPVQSDEQFFELNYGIQATPWLLIRPALQYVIQPGAYTSRPDSFVFSQHLQATF
jgi:porin